MIRRPGYALAAAALFVIEVAIALWLHDRWIRPHGGDVLAVILVYCALRAILPLDVCAAAATALAIACVIEFAQWLNVLRLLGLRADSVTGTVLGSAFDWSDILAYVAGVAVVLLVERARLAFARTRR